LYKQGPNSLTQRVKTCLVLATLAALSCGCRAGSGVTKSTRYDPHARPAVKDATREELLDQYNQIARNLKTVNATVELKPTAGSKYSGVIDEYHEVKAFLLAAREAEIRVIGQAPIVGTTVFDMASDGKTFSVSIPSRHKFLAGSVAVERPSTKPIENLRPQHLVDALLWPEVQKEEAVLFEEFNEENGRFYVLTVLRGGYQTEILRKIWFDRACLEVARLQSFGPKGILLSDIRLSDWQPLDGGAGHSDSSTPSNSVRSFARAIQINRPHDDYTLNLQVAKITVNEEIPRERFKLEQPEGSELVHVGDSAENKQP
jgi:hypothetical protein